MLDVKIRRPLATDIPQLNEFLKIVITDTFNKEGIGDMVDDLQDEIKTKKLYLQSDLESKGKKRYFLIALYDEQIIGTIEYGPASELIKKLTKNAYGNLVEVGTALVHPEFQGKGVGNKLLQAIITRLKSEGIQEFCLDCGYNRAQKIWKKKFGQPDYHFKDYWGKGQDHMIWRVKIN